MHRPVFPTARVHFTAGRLARHPVLFVDYIEKLFQILRHALFLSFIRSFARANFALSAVFTWNKLVFPPS